MSLFIRWAIVAASVAAAAFIVPGIHVGENGWIAVAVMALVLGVVNVFLRPLLKFMACGLIILTLGIFSLVINAGMFLLAANVSQSWFGVDFTVDGFWPAFWGSIVVSLVSVVLTALISENEKPSSR
jgi:putative membrane protein